MTRVTAEAISKYVRENPRPTLEEARKMLFEKNVPGIKRVLVYIGYPCGDQGIFAYRDRESALVGMNAARNLYLSRENEEDREKYMDEFDPKNVEQVRKLFRLLEEEEYTLCIIDNAIIRLAPGEEIEKFSRAEIKLWCNNTLDEIAFKEKYALPELREAMKEAEKAA